ncbi:hypothetical protein PTSG_03646 [Salpingoeca rosetta]|uniref:Uncharacterized protein n=1 Tax=Salpingoeca rosetta (strain ATCC 50818 / BSB-021) TaxID=946362 RepID=F2U669_SALR5|nr:uncharacterized protein PTSG_03646 [Salpingoeca rosetta]EGD83010.1 hypothetical protein PTSG_03646 [Salpingoeca rosetta]|eukprot:XP_004995374.1 hypothetical protein PTSG_03646 [Salpingoeca rosetta]
MTANEEELETLREAVKVRDELLDEMQRALAQKREETDELVEETRRIGEEQARILRLQLDEKHKQVELLQGMVNDMDSNTRLSSDLQGISGSEAQRERPFVDDFLLKVLAERDDLTDKLHDLHNELAETKAKLGTSELDKERLQVEMRMLSTRLQSHAPSPAGSVPSSPAGPAKPKRKRNGSASDEIIRQLNEKIFHLEKELEEHQRQGSRLKRKETQRLKEMERLKTEMDSLAKERATLLTDLRRTKDESTHLALVQTLEEQLKRHEQQRAQLERKLSSLQRENEESTGLIKHLQAKIVEFEQADAVKQAKDLQAKVGSLNDTILDRDNRIHELQQTCDSLREENAALALRVQGLEGDVKDKGAVEERLKAAETELELAQQGFKAAKDENEALSTKCNDLQEQCSQLQDTTATQEQQISEKDSDIAALMAEIEKLNEEADAHIAQKTELERLQALSKQRDKTLAEREAFCDQIVSRFKDEQKRRRALHNQLEH